MGPFSIRLFSPSEALDGILVTTRDDWPGRAVIFPRALARGSISKADSWKGSQGKSFGDYIREARTKT